MAAPSRKPAPTEVGVVALWVTLIALAAARAAAAWTPGTWGWGLDALRDTPPVVGWLLWAAAALALVPALARRLLPGARGLGRGIARGGLPALTIAAVLGAALVWLLPDRTLFVGDALLRQGTVEVLRDPSVLLPGGPGQVLPLDMFLHFTLPRAGLTTHLMSVNTAARALDALEAGLLAILALAFSRVLALEGAMALAASVTVFFGGALGLFTGYDKSYTEMCLVVVALACAGLRMVREGRGHAALGLALAVGFLSHRTALALLPAAAFAWVGASRLHGAGRAPRRVTMIAALALPAVAIAAMLPRILHTIRVLDLSQHFAGDATRAVATVAPLTRAADLANFFLLLAPLAPVVPVLAAIRARTTARSTEAWLLLALVAPFAAMTVALHPRQGLFRDWDVFAAGGLALSLLAAWLIARTLGDAPRRAWLAVAVVAAVMAPGLQWLALHAEHDRGLARARRLALGPPTRSQVERAALWDYIGTRNFTAGRWDAAIEAFRQATAVSPSTRMLRTLATAEQRAGRLRDAQASFRRALEKDPDAAPVWMELEQVSARLGDLEEAWRAGSEVLRLRPDDPEVRAGFGGLDSLRRARMGRPPHP